MDSAERPSAMASRLKPSSVATPSVDRPPLSVLATGTEDACLFRATAEGEIAWTRVSARETIVTICSNILACIVDEE